jgi:hypothetical protein
MFVETLIGLTILAIIIAGAYTALSAKKASSGPKTGGGSSDEGTGTGDGSVTPPIGSTEQ